MVGKPRTEPQTEYCRLMREYVSETCDRLGLTREELAIRIGSKSRMTIQQAQHRASSIGPPTLHAFCEVAGLSREQTAHLWMKWESDRIAQTAYASTFQRVCDRARKTSSPAEWSALEIQVWQDRIRDL